jgi:hypothetical protein
VVFFDLGVQSSKYLRQPLLGYVQRYLFFLHCGDTRLKFYNNEVRLTCDRFQ